MKISEAKADSAPRLARVIYESLKAGVQLEEQQKKQ
jgi:hypothetical protein